MVSRCSTLAIALVASATSLAGTQTPGSVVNGRVAVRVYASLSDSVTRYYPVAKHRLLFYRSASDSIVATTDSTGALTILLAPGDYRLVSAAAVSWHGSDYSWNVPLTVRPGMPIVDLRSPEAQGASAAAQAAATATRRDAGPVALPAGVSRDTAIVYYRSVESKDPSTAVLWSFLIAGGGQIYAGETGKGIGLLLVSSGSAILTIAALQADAVCNSGPFGSSGCEDQGVRKTGAVAALVWISTWIYSMADAGEAARRWNAKHNARNVSLVPIFPEPANGHSLGLAVSIRR
jgi:hypothetical protein